MPAGVVVGFYEGAPPNGTKLGQGTTAKVLYPAESEAWCSRSPALMRRWSTGRPVYAVADDGMPPHPLWHECRTDNNTSTPVSAKCGTAQ